MSAEKGRCEFVGKTDSLRGRCTATSGFWDRGSNGMGLIPYCPLCGRDLCEEHLVQHLCGDMKRAGHKRGSAVRLYQEENE